MSITIKTTSKSRTTIEPGENLRVAYIMSRFPKITETFVLYEMLAVEQAGLAVEVFPLQREKTKVMHPEAAPLVERAHFTPWISWTIVLANLYYLWRKPGRYFTTLWILFWANLGSLRFFAGAMAFFPKAVYFARQMSQRGIDHVHAHFASHPAAVAFVVHRLTDIPYSFTAHGSDLHRDRHMLREKVAAAAFVAAISEYNRELIVAHCGSQAEEKVRILHCGVDTGKFQPPDAATREGRSHGPFNIFCIGTAHEVKGQAYLMEACRILKERKFDFHLSLIGDGPDLPDLKRQAERGKLADSVTFFGRKKRHEIIELLQDANVVAAPSVPTRDGRREGIPVVLMEAMASGVCVVASALSGIPELVKDGETGLLTPPRDARALADALQRLADDTQLQRRLADAGREKVESEFDQDANAALLAAGIREAISSNRVRSSARAQTVSSCVEVPS